MLEARKPSQCLEAKTGAAEPDGLEPVEIRRDTGYLASAEEWAAAVSMSLSNCPA